MISAGRAAVFALAFCAAHGWAAVVRADAADGLRSSLRVRSGATCLTADNVASQVQTWLGSEPVRTDVTIEVDGDRVDPRSASFRVVQAGHTLSHRAFAPGPQVCEHLQAAVGLAIALALKASLLDELGEPLSDDPVARARGGSLAGAGVLAADIVPGLAPGVDLRAELALPPSVSLRTGVFALAGFDKTFERARGRFDAGLVALRADACAGLSMARELRGRLCVGLLGGGLYAQGKSFVQSKTSLVGWYGFVNSASLLYDVSERWSLELGLSLVAPLRRVRVGIRDATGAVVEARNLAAVGFALGLGPVLRL